MNGWELEQLIETPEELQKWLSLSGDEVSSLLGAQSSALPLRITPFYARLIAACENEQDAAALRKMAVPLAAETKLHPAESLDPLAEERYQITPRMVHRYRDRVLILATDSCALYCRHCFRRRFTGEGAGALSSNELEEICSYLGTHPEIHEVLISGGDPLMLNDTRLERVLGRLRSVRDGLVLRVSTRMPVVLPARVSSALVDLLRRMAPVWLVVQINHPAELSASFDSGIRELIEAGIPVLSQSVLLKGVNDDPETLMTLFYGLIERGIRPYYLFQGDLAAGTAHFRVNLKRAVEIYSQLQRQVSGLALPNFAVDLPDGGGKIRLHQGSIAGETEEGYLLRDAEGREYYYPNEE